MEYINKEDGTKQELESIKREYIELISNTDEFNEYKDDFDKFLLDYYEELE